MYLLALVSQKGSGVNISYLPKVVLTLFNPPVLGGEMLSGVEPEPEHEAHSL